MSIMHKVILNSFVIVGLLFLTPLQAQKKELSFAQAWGQEASVTQPINQYIGWADNDHYIERDRTDGRRYQVHVKTNERTYYMPPVQSDTEVSIKNKDIYIRYGNDPERRLTQSPDVEEKNPTLYPDGKYVAFTRDNDLYSVKIEDGSEVRYTSDGTNVIYNGWSSWVYYEEILGRVTNYKAFWWSPDSKQLAFMRFDDTQVPMFPIYVSKGQHGYLEATRYPKAGDPNPEVKVGFVQVEGSPVIWADFNEKDDQYFGEPYWSFDSQSIMVQWMNRYQTNLKFYSVNHNDIRKHEIYDEQQSTCINLDHSERITYLADNKHYILKSDRTGWAHYYLYTLDGKLVNPLTSGDWQVTSLELVDEKNN